MGIVPAMLRWLVCLVLVTALCRGNESQGDEIQKTSFVSSSAHAQLVALPPSGGVLTAYNEWLEQHGVVSKLLKITPSVPAALGYHVTAAQSIKATSCRP